MIIAFALREAKMAIRKVRSITIRGPFPMSLSDLTTDVQKEI